MAHAIFPENCKEKWSVWVLDEEIDHHTVNDESLIDRDDEVKMFNGEIILRGIQFDPKSPYNRISLKAGQRGHACFKRRIPNQTIVYLQDREENPKKVFMRFKDAKMAKGEMRLQLFDGPLYF